MRLFIILFLLSIFVSGCVTADDIIEGSVSPRFKAQVDASSTDVRNEIKREQIYYFTGCLYGNLLEQYKSTGSYDLNSARSNTICSQHKSALNYVIQATSSMKRSDWKNNTARETIRRMENQTLKKFETDLELFKAEGLVK